MLFLFIRCYFTFFLSGFHSTKASIHIEYFFSRAEYFPLQSYKCCTDTVYSSSSWHLHEKLFVSFWVKICQGTKLHLQRVCGFQNRNFTFCWCQTDNDGAWQSSKSHFAAHSSLYWLVNRSKGSRFRTKSWLSPNSIQSFLFFKGTQHPSYT